MNRDQEEKLPGTKTVIAVIFFWPFCIGFDLMQWCMTPKDTTLQRVVSGLMSIVAMVLLLFGLVWWWWMLVDGIWIPLKWLSTY